MFFADALTLDAPRRTRDGYLAVRAKAARTGVYQYSGSEVDPDNAHGLRDKASINVLRDDATVFDEAAARSFIGKPITNDHPKEAVTASNWRDHARGTIMGALRDGDYLAFDLMLTDADAIAAIDGGKRELSNGYSSNLEFGDFDGPGGVKCQARQTSITGNHIALVDRGRAGAECRIADAAPCSAAPRSFLDSLTNDGEPIVTTKTITFDGLPLLVTDAAEAAINKQAAVITALTADKATLETKTVADAATIVAKDAEIAKLTADLAAAKLTPQQMRDAGKAYAIVCAKAKAAGVTVTDAMDDAAIMRAVVDKAMGDKAKDYSDEHVAIAFEAITKDVKVDAPKVEPLGAPKVITDGATAVASARATWLADKQNAHRAQPAS